MHRVRRRRKLSSELRFVSESCSAEIAAAIPLNSCLLSYLAATSFGYNLKHARLQPCGDPCSQFRKRQTQGLRTLRLKLDAPEQKSAYGSPVIFAHCSRPSPSCKELACRWSIVHLQTQVGPSGLNAPNKRNRHSQRGDDGEKTFNWPMLQFRAPHVRVRPTKLSPGSFAGRGRSRFRNTRRFADRKTCVGR